MTLPVAAAVALAAGLVLATRAPGEAPPGVVVHAAELYTPGRSPGPAGAPGDPPRFRCGDDIRVRVNWSAPRATRYRLTVTWSGEDGEAERASESVEGAGATVRLVSDYWLRISERGARPWSWPSHREERWGVLLTIDGRPVVSRPFVVRC